MRGDVCALGWRLREAVILGAPRRLWCTRHATTATCGGTLTDDDHATRELWYF